MKKIVSDSPQVVARVWLFKSDRIQFPPVALTYINSSHLNQHETQRHWNWHPADSVMSRRDNQQKFSIKEKTFEAMEGLLEVMYS